MSWFKAHHLGTAVLALIVANMIWGAAPPIFKWALADIGPFSLAFLRFAIASLLIYPFARKHLHIENKDIAEVFLIGFLGVTVNIAFFFLGLKLAPSINASIINSSAPIFLIIFSFFLLKERPKHRLITGSLIGLAGVSLIIFQPFFTSEKNLNFLGNMFFFLATFAGLGHTILGRILVKKYEPLGVAFWCFLVGAFCFLPLCINENLGKSIITQLTLPSVTGILFGAVLSSGVAYFLFFWALKYMQASETGVFLYIDPVITVIIAMPLLGEKPDAFYLIGAALVFAGIYVAEGRIHWHPLHLLKGS
jgi:drug/metabolite transporter (DMT)-like permease